VYACICIAYGQISQQRTPTDFVIVALEESAEFFMANWCLTCVDDVLRQQRPEFRNDFVMFLPVEQSSSCWNDGPYAYANQVSVFTEQSHTGFGVGGLHG